MKTHISTLSLSIGLLSLSIGLSCGLLSAAGPWDTATIQQRLNGPIHVRIETLKEILVSEKLLADPGVRRVVIGDLNQSNHDPNWEELARIFHESSSEEPRNLA